MENSRLSIIPKGTSILTAVEAITRLVRRAKVRALVAKRRYERTQEKIDEENWCCAAEEYYYAAALGAEFKTALQETLAAMLHEKSEKDGSVN